jgi:hypothetical protein
MHLVKLIERRFPNHKAGITAALVVLSLSFLALGLGLLFIR